MKKNENKNYLFVLNLSNRANAKHEWKIIVLARFFRLANTDNVTYAEKAPKQH